MEKGNIVTFTRVKVKESTKCICFKAKLLLLLHFRHYTVPFLEENVFGLKIVIELTQLIRRNIVHLQTAGL